MNSFPNRSAGVEPGIQLTNYMPYHTYIEYTLFTIRRGIQHTPMYICTKLWKVQGYYMYMLFKKTHFINSNIMCRCR